MTESPYRAFAERHDLDYAERVAERASGRFPLPRGDVSELAGGTLPGGAKGIVARLQAEAQLTTGEAVEVGLGGEVEGLETRRRSHREIEAIREFMLIATRIPESVGFARFLTCRQAGFRGVVDRALGPGGLGLIQEFELESIEFNRRYKLVMLSTGSENRLRQLFAPTFIDWMANSAPDGLYFDLVSGVLTVTFAGGQVREVGDVERACELANRIRERIRSEALEGDPLEEDGSDPGAAAWAEADSQFERQLEEAGLSAGATDAATAADRLAPVLGGLMGRLLRSRKKPQVRIAALSVVLRSFGERNGLEQVNPRGLHELLPVLDNFPLPVMRLGAVRGALPGAESQGELRALAILTSLGSEVVCWPAIEVPTAAPPGDFVQVLPRDEERGSAPTAIGGFTIALAGERRETEATRRAREQAEALAASVGGERFVVGRRSNGTGLVGSAAEAWLRDEPRRALVLAGGELTLLDTPRPALEWSFEVLDGFCEAAAPVIAELAAPAR